MEYKVHANHVTKLKSDCKNLEIAGQFQNVNPVCIRRRIPQGGGSQILYSREDPGFCIGKDP